MIVLTVFITCIAAAVCGFDYVAEVNRRQDVLISRKLAAQWLLAQRNKEWGWGTRDFPETHRVLTALSLSGEMQNETESLEYQISVKQLELELSLALSRSNKKISAGQLGLYSNALVATCRDPNDFYGRNIVKIMRPRPKLSVYAEALVSLAVSNSGNLLRKQEILHYFDILDSYSNQTHFTRDTKAMVVLALSSTMKSGKHYLIKAHLRKTLKSFKNSQTQEGSFGNIYTSGLVVQALIGAEDKGKGWSFQKGLDYILSQQKDDGSFGDVLATYFVLPVLAGKSFVDLRNIPCGSINGSLQGNDTEERWQGMISVRYSVWANTNVSDVFTVPENSTFYDAMEIAQKLDDRFRFSGKAYSWGFNVQTIGNLSNDAVCNKYWMLYRLDRRTGELAQTEYGVTQEIPKDGDHYIFRYMKLSFESYDVNPQCEDDLQESNTTATTEENDVDQALTKRSKFLS